MAFIGKNVLENLTTAMYEDLQIIYREYIQNAADSIDKAVASQMISAAEAKIDIDINVNKRSITILDNGIGICAHQFVKTMSSIADSTKDRSEEKGFRGIGRLGGISSCDYLQFSCSAYGEGVASTCRWDAKTVREIFVDKSRNPSAAELVDAVTEYSTAECDYDEHFFKVELIDVVPAAGELLSVNQVKSYLCSVAPIPYAVGFMFGSKIEAFAKDNGFRIDEYPIFLNGERLFKQYATNLYEQKNNYKKTYDTILDVEFKIFKDKDDRTLAWMWYGISKFEKQIPSINPMRGIRLRKGNIQIGNENTFSFHNFYDETRGGLYFVGEVFAVHEDLIPNARRDYFNLNETCRAFEEQLRPLFFDRFKTIYHYANDYKKALQKQQDLANAESEYQKKVSTGTFLDSDDKKKFEEALEEKKQSASKAAKQLESRSEKSQGDDVLSKVYKALRQSYPIQPETVKETAKNSNSKTKTQYKSQALSQYSKKEQKLIGRIYSIINAILPHDTAELVINKVQEELSK